MPPSEKKKLRRAVAGLLFQQVLLGEHDGVWDTEAIDEIVDLHAGLATTRYLRPRKKATRSVTSRHKVLDMKDEEFYQAIRITKPTFVYIHDLIKSDCVFQNKSHCPQRSSQLQLAVALEWYGGHGNANAVGRIARTYKIGTGTVTTYVRRVQKALLRHYGRFVSWPTAERRAESSAYHLERYGLEGVVGFVDGTHVIFDQKPHIDGSLHFNRKSRYSLNVQVVCDESKRIIMAFTGWPGSCHDSTVYSKMPIPQHPDRYFSEGEYLVGDTGYALTPRLIVPFKRPASESAENTAFNETLSSARVVNENCIGLLKNRWMSLKGIRTQIRLRSDFIVVNNHILACVLLHNICLHLEDSWEDEGEQQEDEVNEPTEDEPQLTGPDLRRAGVRRREEVKAVLFGRILALHLFLSR